MNKNIKIALLKDKIVIVHTDARIELSADSLLLEVKNANQQSLLKLSNNNIKITAEKITMIANHIELTSRQNINFKLANHDSISLNDQWRIAAQNILVKAEENIKLSAAKLSVI